MTLPGRARQQRPEMTQEELEALPVAFELPIAGRAYGMGRTKAYELAKRGEFPCRVLRIGNAYRVTRADLLRSLGLDPLTAAPQIPTAA